MAQVRQVAPYTTYEYAANGQLDTITDPLGRETTYAYDDFGRRTSMTDHLGSETLYDYNDINQVVKVTEEDPDGAGPLVAPVTEYTFNLLHQLTRIEDPNDGFTDFTYDDSGNLLTLTDPVGNETSYSYDRMGRVTIETNELADSRSFYYDSLGRMTRRVDRNERVMQFEYDLLDRIEAQRWYSSATPVPALSISTTTEGGDTEEVQRVGMTDSFTLYGGTFTLTFDGQTTSAIAYDGSASAVASALEGLSNIDVGEVSVVKSQDTYETQEWTVTFTGGLAGTNVAQITVDSTNVMGYGISDIEATDTQGGSGDEVQLVTLSNANSGTLRLAFAGETTAELDQDATAAEVETALEDLNSVDNVTVTGSAGGPWTVTFVGTHAGENQPRLDGDAASATSGTEEREIAYTYDVGNQLTSVTDPDSTYDYTYDNLGRVLTVDNDGTPGVPNVILTSAYDANGNRTSLSAEIDSTGDFLNTYSYDALNRLTRVDQEGQTGGNTVNEKRVDFQYNALGQYTEIARFNDTAGGTANEIATSTYTYDTLGRITGLEYENGGTDLFTPYSWSYDSLNRVTQFVSQDGTSDYDYDITSQLTGADHDYQTDETYSYDANGNRTMTGYTTGTNNQLTNDGTHSYEYDDEGNRTLRTNDTTFETTEYDWDYRNRLIRVTDKDEYGTTTQVVEYTYDVFNRRIAKAVDTTSSFDMADAVIESFVYDDITGVTSLDRGNVVLDFVDDDGTGASTPELERRYLYSNAVDQILVQENVSETTTSADRIYWLLADNLGTVRDLAANDATIAEHFKYDSFGAIQSGDTTLTRYLFTSREWDADAGLQYSRARWYDSGVGKWVSEDPLSFHAGDTNVSRYVSNAPTLSRDPSGLQDPVRRPAPVTGIIGIRNGRRSPGAPYILGDLPDGVMGTTAPTGPPEFSITVVTNNGVTIPQISRLHLDMRLVISDDAPRGQRNAILEHERLHLQGYQGHIDYIQHLVTTAGNSIAMAPAGQQRDISREYVNLWRTRFQRYLRDTLSPRLLENQRQFLHLDHLTHRRVTMQNGRFVPTNRRYGHPEEMERALIELRRSFPERTVHLTNPGTVTETLNSFASDLRETLGRAHAESIRQMTGVINPNGSDPNGSDK